MARNVAAILLNWNSAKSTIECINSVLSNTQRIKSIVVVDNFSGEEDFKSILQFLSELSKVRVITSVVNENNFYQITSDEINVSLIRSEKNSGYAGGNNLGITFAMIDEKHKYFWILNNDAKAKPDALQHLHAQMTNNEKLGFISSVTLNDDLSIEAFGGGTYFPLLGKAKLLHKNQPYDKNLPIKLNYLMGASLLVKRSVIDKVGLMDECFFMYSEEVDWQWRAKAMGFELAVAPESLVVHLGSGSSSSWKYHYYRNRGAIMFNSIHYGCLFSLLSAVMLSCYMLMELSNSPKSFIWGVKGAFAGICKNRKVKFQAI